MGNLFGPHKEGVLIWQVRVGRRYKFAPTRGWEAGTAGASQSGCDDGLPKYSLGQARCAGDVGPGPFPASPSRSSGTSDSGPSDLDAWRVLLPSQPHAERVARLVLHENASRDDAADLALLRLRAPVNLSAALRPVCLAHPEHYFLPGSRCRLARWGRAGARGPGAAQSGAGSHWSLRRLAAFPPTPPETAPGPSTQLEAELLSSWWCHCLYGRQGAPVPLAGDPPLVLCPAYREEEEAGRCWVRLGLGRGLRRWEVGE